MTSAAHDAGGAFYLDSSAIVKLVRKETESSALRQFLQEPADWVSSAIVRTEVIRAVRGGGPAAVARARSILREIGFMPIDDEVLDEAARLEPLGLRTLDAIHIASVLSVSDDLAGAVTYDRRMADGLRHAGIDAVAPR